MFLWYVMRFFARELLLKCQAEISRTNSLIVIFLWEHYIFAHMTERSITKLLITAITLFFFPEISPHLFCLLFECPIVPRLN